jgi:hypothetical protein
MRNRGKIVDKFKSWCYINIWRNKMNNLYEYLTKEYNAYFTGWDFSYLNGRMEEDVPPGIIRILWKIIFSTKRHY